jgi:hypothetical protein
VQLKENLEKYKLVRIHCQNQKQLLELIDIIDSEKLDLYYWYPNTHQLEPSEHLESVRQIVLGDDFIEPYPKPNEPSILTLKNSGWAVVLTISTISRKLQFDDDISLEIDFTNYLREKNLNNLGL